MTDAHRACPSCGGECLQRYAEAGQAFALAATGRVTETAALLALARAIAGCPS